MEIEPHLLELFRRRDYLADLEVHFGANSYRRSELAALEWTLAELSIAHPAESEIARQTAKYLANRRERSPTSCAERLHR